MELINTLGIFDGAVDAIGKVINDAFRNIAFFIDRIVYWLIPTLYKLIVSLANVDLYNNNSAITALMNRVYILVGVFMLFRLAFSVIQYIIDPNAFSDESKGITNLVKRVIIAIVLLVTVPLLFSQIYNIQGKILNSNVIPNLILGTSSGEVTDLEDAAKDVQFLIFSPFFSINYESPKLSNCEPTGDFEMANILGTNDMLLAPDGKQHTEQDTGSCIYEVADAMDNDDTVVASGVDISDFFGEDKNFKAFGGIVNMMVEGQYAIEYRPIISTLVGGYMVFLLLSFCIDIAVRAIKLMFLQILSPIAIISSVDPTSSSQNDRLKEWGKECLTTFLSLFLRLAVIYVVIQAVKVVTGKVFTDNLYYEGFNPDKSLNKFIYIFLVLGAFQAAKNIPGLIEKALGIKLSGELNMNPFKAIGDTLNQPIVSNVIGGVAGGLTGTAAGFGSALTTGINLGHGGFRTVTGALGGALTGGITSTIGGARAGGMKGAGVGFKSGGRISRRMTVRDQTGGYGGSVGMALDRVRNKMGGQTTFEIMESRAKRYDDVGAAIKSMEERAVGELTKKSNAWKNVQARRLNYEQAMRDGEMIDESTRSQRMTALDSEYSNLRQSMLNMDASSDAYKEGQARLKQIEDLSTQYRNGVMTNDMYVDLQNQLYDEEQGLISDYIDSGKDDQMVLYRNSLEKAMKDSGMHYEYDKDGNPMTDWSSIAGQGDNTIKKRAEHSALDIRADKSYNDAKDRHEGIHAAMDDAYKNRK